MQSPRRPARRKQRRIPRSLLPSLALACLIAAGGGCSSTPKTTDPNAAGSSGWKMPWSGGSEATAVATAPVTPPEAEAAQPKSVFGRFALWGKKAPPAAETPESAMALFPPAAGTRPQAGAAPAAGGPPNVSMGAPANNGLGAPPTVQRPGIPASPASYNPAATAPSGQNPPPKYGPNWQPPAAAPPTYGSQFPPPAAGAKPSGALPTASNPAAAAMNPLPPGFNPVQGTTPPVATPPLASPTAGAAAMVAGAAAPTVGAPPPPANRNLPVGEDRTLNTMQVAGTASPAPAAGTNSAAATPTGYVPPAATSATVAAAPTGTTAPASVAPAATPAVQTLPAATVAAAPAATATPAAAVPAGYIPPTSTPAPSAIAPATVAAAPAAPAVVGATSSPNAAAPVATAAATAPAANNVAAAPTSAPPAPVTIAPYKTPAAPSVAAPAVAATPAVVPAAATAVAAAPAAPVAVSAPAVAQAAPVPSAPSAAAVATTVSAVAASPAPAPAAAPVPVLLPKPPVELAARESSDAPQPPPAEVQQSLRIERLPNPVVALSPPPALPSVESPEPATLDASPADLAVAEALPPAPKAWSDRAPESLALASLPPSSKAGLAALSAPAPLPTAMPAAAVAPLEEAVETEQPLLAAAPQPVEPAKKSGNEKYESQRPLPKTAREWVARSLQAYESIDNYHAETTWQVGKGEEANKVSAEFSFRKAPHAVRLKMTSSGEKELLFVHGPEADQVVMAQKHPLGRLITTVSADDPNLLKTCVKPLPEWGVGRMLDELQSALEWERTGDVTVEYRGERPIDGAKLHQVVVRSLQSKDQIEYYFDAETMLPAAAVVRDEKGAVSDFERYSKIAVNREDLSAPVAFDSDSIRRR